jgi:hypothetical protein
MGNLDQFSIKTEFLISKGEISIGEMCASLPRRVRRSNGLGAMIRSYQRGLTALDRGIQSPVRY